MLWAIAPAHYATLLGGSAVVSSASWVYDAYRTQKPSAAAALGSSGIVCGLATSATCFFPTMPMKVLGIVPIELWICTVSLMGLECYSLVYEPDSMFGSAAHVGGGVFGFLYYTLFLRRYGGIFGTASKIAR